MLQTLISYSCCFLQNALRRTTQRENCITYVKEKQLPCLSGTFEFRSLNFPHFLTQRCFCLLFLFFLLVYMLQRCTHTSIIQISFCVVLFLFPLSTFFIFFSISVPFSLIHLRLHFPFIVFQTRPTSTHLICLPLHPCCLLTHTRTHTHTHTHSFSLSLSTSSSNNQILPSSKRSLFYISCCLSAYTVNTHTRTHARTHAHTHAHTHTHTHAHTHRLSLLIRSLQCRVALWTYVGWWAYITSAEVNMAAAPCVCVCVCVTTLLCLLTVSLQMTVKCVYQDVFIRWCSLRSHTHTADVHRRAVGSYPLRSCVALLLPAGRSMTPSALTDCRLRIFFVCFFMLLLHFKSFKAAVLTTDVDFFCQTPLTSHRAFIWNSLHLPFSTCPPDALRPPHLSQSPDCHIHLLTCSSLSNHHISINTKTFPISCQSMGSLTQPLSWTFGLVQSFVCTLVWTCMDSSLDSF